MHELIERGLAIEVRGPQCMSYILEDESLFNLSEYKIIHNQGTEKFLDSTKSTYNGKVKLTYFLDEYVSLQSIAGAVEVYPFIGVLANTIGSILEISGNGYLDLSDLVLTLNRIYVNPTTLDVKLIYLPVNTPPNSGTSLLMNSPIDELRSGLVKLISSTPGLMSSRTREIASWLSDSSMSLEAIYTAMRVNNDPIRKPDNKQKNYVLVIKNLTPHDRTEFKISQNNGTSFVIGRNAVEVDGYIGTNPAISGKHCIIYGTTSGFEIEDISKNGTFINNARLTPGKRIRLNDMDSLRLANSNFSVSITEG